MTRLSFDVPAVISRWKQKNARRLRSVLWIFATCVPGAVWKRSPRLARENAACRTEVACSHVSGLFTQAGWILRRNRRKTHQSWVAITETSNPVTGF
jgi:hypothetical protein